METIAQIQNDLNLYRQAREKILLGQEYTIGSRKLRRPDLAVVEKSIRDLETRLAIALNQGRIKSASVVFGGNR
jgi:hypothetical protein